MGMLLWLHLKRFVIEDRQLLDEQVDEQSSSSASGRIAFGDFEEVTSMETPIAQNTNDDLTSRSAENNEEHRHEGHKQVLKDSLDEYDDARATSLLIMSTNSVNEVKRTLQDSVLPRAASTSRL